MKSISIGLWIFLIGFCFTLKSYSHALHPDSMDRHAEITFAPSKMIVIYQAIGGINPTEHYTRRLDPDNDGTITDEERNSFIKNIAAEYAKNQKIHIGEYNLDLQFHSGDAYASVGHNGMNVIKVDIAYTAEYPAALTRNVTQSFMYEDNNFNTVPGWKQLNVSTRDGAIYSGFIPYQEFAPFDYEIIATKGFTPSSEKLKGEVSIPPAENSDSTEVIMPEKVIPKEVMLFQDLVLNYIAYGLAGLLAMIVIMLGYRSLKMRQ